MISEEKIRIYNKKLESNLWYEDQNLKPGIRIRLLKVAKDFYISTDFKSEIYDILLLGSSVNYTWTSESDVDIHIVIDITKEGLDPNHYRKFLDSLTGKWNKEHNISIYGHKVELYLQDITEKNSTPEKARPHGAMFSLLHNKWLVPPKYDPPILDKSSIKKAFHKIKDQINKVVDSRNLDGLKELMEFIRNYRNKGLESEDGEFSTENIVFKALRHTGMLEKLKNGINSIYDRMVSIEEMESYLNKLNSIDENVIHELIEETIEELEEKDKSYVIVGGVDDTGKIAIIKSEKINKPLTLNQPYHSHSMLYKGDFDINPNTALNWRYRSDSNELMYYDYPSEIQSIAVKQYLKDNCKLIELPKVVIASQLSSDHRKSFHDLDYQYKNGKLKESIIDKNSNLYLGIIIRENFKIYGINVDDDEYTHEDFLRDNNLWKMWDSEFIPWRYKRNNNTIYWWYAKQHPTEDEKMEIEEWLNINVGAPFKDIQHKWISNSPIILKTHPEYGYNRGDAHDKN